MSTPFNRDPLSVRLNNPGNLRFAGQAGAVADPSGFARFNSPEEGMNAMQRQLELDLQKRGLTLGGMLNKYAPQAENDTGSYVNFVSQQTGLDPNQPVPADRVPDVMQAMIRMEGGNRASQVYGQRPLVQTAAAPTQTATDAPPPEAQSVPIGEKYANGFAKALEANDTEAAAFIGTDIQEKLQRGIRKARDAKDEEAAKFLEQQLSTATSRIYTTAQQTGDSKLADKIRSSARRGGKWDNDIANVDPIWIQNAKTLYRNVEGKDFTGGDQEAADWLKNYMGQFNYNLVSTGTAAVNADKWDNSGKVAFLQAMKDYDELPVSMEGFGRFLKGIGTDPTTYVGLGIGSAVSKLTGRTAMKAGIKEAIEQGLEKSIVKRIAGSTATKVGAEGAIYAGGQNALTQAAEVGAGGREVIDLGEVATSAGTGAVLGAGASKVVDKLTGRAGVRDFVRRAGSEQNAKIDAEVVDRAIEIAQDPARNLWGKDADSLKAKTLNQAVTKSFTDPVVEALDAIPRAQRPQNFNQLKSALQTPVKLSEAQRNALRGTPYGDAVADAIERAIRSEAITSAVAARGGMSALLRAGLDIAPIPQALRFGLRTALGRRFTREDVTAGLLRNQKAARTVAQELGPSNAPQSLQNLQGFANNIIQQNQAKAQAQATQKAARQAQEAADRIKSAAELGVPRGPAVNEVITQTGVDLRDLPGVLRFLSSKYRGTGAGEAASQLRRSPEAVTNRQGFFDLQDLLRSPTEQGILSRAGVLNTPVRQATRVADEGVRFPKAYEAQARANQQRVTNALADVNSTSLSPENKIRLSEAVAKIGTTNNKTEARVIRDALLKSVSPGETAEVRRILGPLVEQIRHETNPRS